MRRGTVALAFSLTLTVAGCATIVGDKTHLMAINTTPSNAEVVITDEKGVDVFKGITPTSVTLEKSDGSYWGGKRYVVTISKSGYQPQVIVVDSSPNGWYIGGNILFGGLIGWFIVDPLNGAMYNLTPEQITATLGEESVRNDTASDGSISILLLDDVPGPLRDRMTRLR